MSGTGTKDTQACKEKRQADSINPPFISVMVLNYNYGDLLGRALEACAAQTFQDFEIIMINNGAVDNTEQIYQSFCKKYPNIKTTYIYIEQNQGPMHGWNVGIKHAQGEYVMFNDADDWMEPDCLEKLAEKARETGADRVTGQYREIMPNGSIVRERKFTAHRSIPTGMLQGVIFRRSIILCNEIFFPDPYEQKMYEYDVWFTCRFAMFLKNAGAVVTHVIYNYYFNPRANALVLFNEGDKQFFNSRVKMILNCAAETVMLTNDKEIQQEIEYLSLKFSYSYILRNMRQGPWRNAKEFHDYTYAILKERFPCWKKNPFLWPIGNGYELVDSVALYMLVKMDQLHAGWMICVAGKLSSLFKFRR